MNFYAHQELARKQTRRMLWLFAISVVLVVLALDLFVFFVLIFGAEADIADIGPFLVVSSVVFLSIIGVASIYKVLSLREGGGAVARHLGGVRVDPTTKDMAHRRLMNIVEEMAIASGMTCPEVYVLDQESAINAFAAGYSVADAAVTVTQGALTKLSRDELQGVIAHEFSHILNGDMRLNIHLTGVLFGLMAIGVIGREFLQLGGRGRRVQGVVWVGLGLMVLGFLGLFLGRLIKASISRSREFDADATAVQFTRLSDGIAGALKKIGGFQKGSALKHRKTEEIEHMLFADGEGFGRMLATHPDLPERIRRLDPQFRIEQFAALGRVERDVAEEPQSARQLLGFAPSQPNAVLTNQLAALKNMQSRAAMVSEQVARPELRHVRHAESIREKLPPLLVAAAGSRAEALNLILLLALADNQTQRKAQLSVIQQHLGPAVAKRVENLDLALGVSPRVLQREQKLPLASLAFQSLKKLEKQVLDAAFATVVEMLNVDGLLELYEFCLIKMLQHFISEAAEPSAIITRSRKLSDEKSAIALVLATFAAQGHPSSTEAQAAYGAGLSLLFAEESLAYLPAQNLSRELESAITRLDQLAPYAKRRLILALVSSLQFDGRVAPAEAELLRVLCLCMHCPMPALLDLE